jgi:hypothetical protein
MSNATTPKYPDVHVQLSGRDGNAFAIIAAVVRALQIAGETAAANDFTSDAFSCPSYDGLLRLAAQTVDVS